MDIHKIKIKHSNKHIGILVCTEDGNPYGFSTLPKNRWRKEYLRFVDAILNENKRYIISLVETDENLNITNLINKEIIN